MKLELTHAEASLVGQALSLLSTQVDIVCDSFEGCDKKYNAAHEFYKGKRAEIAALHVKLINARVGQ